MPSVINERTQFLDESGAPIVNGYIYIGSQNQNPVTNPITIYSDRGLSTTISNPQRTDADGRAENKIWVPGRYSLKVEDVDNVQKLLDLDRGEDPDTGTTKLTNVQGANTITAEGAGELIDGQIYIFQAVADNSDTVTLNIGSTGDYKIVLFPGVNITSGAIKEDQQVAVVWDEDNTEYQLISRSFQLSVYPANYISGGLVTIDSDGDTDHDVDISALKARNDDDDLNLIVAASAARACDTLWAEGGAGLMAENGTTGSPIALPTSGTVHFFVISEDADPSNQDFCCDTDPYGGNIGTASSATEGWTVERRVASLTTDSSANLIEVDSYELASGLVKYDLQVAVSDYSATAPGNSAVLRAVSVPSGILVDVIHAFSLLQGAADAAGDGIVTSPKVTNVIPTSALHDVSTPSGAARDTSTKLTTTNLSRQIRTRINNSSATVTVAGTTFGWLDRR